MSFKFPVFLKFHNNGNQVITNPRQQYEFWTTIFKDADITVICEDGTVNHTFCNHRIIPKFTGYKDDDWQIEVSQKVLGFWKNHFFANVTPTIASKSEYFWIIDADDMRFIIDSESKRLKVTESLKQIEKIVLAENLYFANFDVRYTSNYMMFVNTPEAVGWGHPCLGISLMKNENFYDSKNLEIKKEFLGVNHDILLHVIHHRKKNSKVFCIKDVEFHHYNFQNIIQDMLLFTDEGLIGIAMDGNNKIMIPATPIRSEIIL
jgi:hypothetical protein